MITPDKRKKNRDNVGALLRAKREAAGLTQKALAEILNLEYYTLISQLENGYTSIPPTM